MSCCLCGAEPSGDNFRYLQSGNPRTKCRNCENQERDERRKKSVNKIKSVTVSSNGAESVDDDVILGLAGIDPETVNIKQSRLVFNGTKVNKTIYVEPKLDTQVIRPVSIGTAFKFPEIKYEDGLLDALVIPDIQMGFWREGKNFLPFQDRQAMSLVWQIAREIQPKYIYVLGDYLDFTEFTKKFKIALETRFTTQPAIEEGAWWLYKLREYCPNSIIRLIIGNHDVRSRNFMEEANPAFAALRNPKTGHPYYSIQNLLDTDSMGIEVSEDYPLGHFWLNDNFKLLHGDRYDTKSGHSALKYLTDARSSIGCGHTHRAEYAVKTVWCHDGPKLYSAYSFGCLVDLRGRIPKHGTDPNWQNAFGAIDFEPGDGSFHVDLPIIFDGRCVFRGRKYLADFDREAQRKDLGF